MKTIMMKEKTLVIGMVLFSLLMIPTGWANEASSEGVGGPGQGRMEGLKRLRQENPEEFRRLMQEKKNKN